MMKMPPCLVRWRNRGRVDIPDSLMYDSEAQEYFMLATKFDVTDFAISIGIYPSRLITGKYSPLSYATWSGPSANILRRRLKIE